MARLNEPPIAPAPAPAPSADTVDAVKRRCLRQNRELAKINSQQSIRIRTLENDASRMLSENLSLREQVLHLQNLVEAQSKGPSFENIDTVKEQLEAKLQEFGALVAGLGQLKKDDEGLPQCKSQLAAKRSPGQRQWRSGLCLQEVENAMMPTITEDKSYPRRTMNADELQNILNDQGSQSPDIGPPPVSRFENEDPIAFTADPPPEEQTAGTEEQEPALLSHFETRRRRRESGPRPNIRRVSLFESTPEENDESATKAIRAGAKRKFSVQEDEDKSHPAAEPFRYSRRNAPTASETSNSNEQSRPQSPQRPVLGSKPVNTDPVLSPKKQRSSVTEKLDKPDKPEKKSLPKPSRNRLTIPRNAQTELPLPEMPPPIPVAEINLDSLPPKTPAAELICSPPTTEPSTSRPESNDTPPPGDIGAGTQASMSARPSRRSRPQVSYKEPSLNAKMRRPGKELADAVISEQLRRTSVDSQGAPSTVARTSILDPEDSAWKPMGAGAAVGRVVEDGAETGSPLRQKMDRNEEAQETKPEAPKLNSAAASNAIATLINETSIAKRRAPVPPPALSWKPDAEPVEEGDVHKPAEKPEKQDDMAIFDFNESSPANSDNPSSATTYSRPRTELAKAARNARRHSSGTAGAATEQRKTYASTKTEKAENRLSSVHKRTVSGTIRSSSASSLARSSASARASAKAKESREKLPASVSFLNVSAKAEGDGRGSVPTERASRRKSTMI
ncbi:hypothetical protein P280DRAFT_200324 [Massarina eburnea CBS 473.64]|uniref:Shugoshin n=1 Tax=Massarina eburnea CBS 473.64 TaxID=1395130 RepID=A0A6A6RM47_9PLEO|nr:hypothetical protein P280DRAFT_200324 [Massarina eburnea CBS 473.64]